jgi:proline racemase
MPWIGAAIGLLTIGETIRRKGVIGGAFDTGLNAIPLIGAAKNTVEVIRGRDFFPDRR